MNIVLIHPYIIVRDPEIGLSEPLGLISLATYLKEVYGNEINISVLDLYAMGAAHPVKSGEFFTKGVSGKTEILKELGKLKPDVIGITCCFTGYFQEALEVGKISKEAFPSSKIIMGGAHATLEAKNVLSQNPYIDIIVRNEGEITLAELIKSFKENTPMERIDGISYRNSYGEIFENKNRLLIEDMDIIPVPDRKFIDMDFYKFSNFRLFNFSRKQPLLTVMTSRGCPYECVFCCTKNLWFRKWRPLNIKKVFEEIEILVSEYGAKEILILDDQFIINKERLYEFCNYFIEKDLKISFSNVAGISTWLADDDVLLAKMRKAGFYKITLPIESGSSETIKFIKKPIDLEKVKILVSKANKLGYWTGAFFIIGFPYEDYEQMKKTIDYAYNSELDFAHFFIAQPYVGTELREIYRKENLLETEETKGTHIFHSWLNTKTMTAQSLNQIQEKAQNGWMMHKVFFYLKPGNFFSNLLPKFKTIEDLGYSFSILFMLIGKNYKLTKLFKKKKKSVEVV